MKRTFLTTITLVVFSSFFCFSSVFAQTRRFGGPGSEWFHTMTYGVFHSYYIGDTTILGIRCSKVAQKAIKDTRWSLSGFRVENLPDIYLYNTADTVFIYNHLYSSFTPLYVFNVSAGDTVTLPLLPPEPAYIPTTTDTFFSYVVDSVKWIRYDTTLLKTVFTTPIEKPSPYHYYTYGWYDTPYNYAEHIGNLQTGIVAVCHGCAMILTESVQWPLKLRCYNDSVTAIKLVSGDCGVPSTGIAEINVSDNIALFPNPAAEMIHIVTNGVKGSLTMLSPVGSILLEQQVDPNGDQILDTHGWPDGVYFVRMHMADGSKYFRQISILH